VSRLLIISNRLPISISREKGQLKVVHSVGGLATGEGSVYKNFEGLWLGRPGYNLQNMQKEKTKLTSCSLRRTVTQLSNVPRNPRVLWRFLQTILSGHCSSYFPLYAKYNPKYWNSYKKVNEKFFNALMDIAQPDDIRFGS
jgi:trehalose 6-phosphate synthase/phosphatase